MCTRLKIISVQSTVQSSLKKEKKKGKKERKKGKALGVIQQLCHKLYPKPVQLNTILPSLTTWTENVQLTHIQGHKIFTSGQQNTTISSLANDLHWSHKWENLKRSYHHAKFEGSCVNNTQENTDINAFAMSPRASVTSVNKYMPKS